MIAVLLSLLAQAADPPPVRPVEHWEPWLSWACLVSAGEGKPWVINGVVARRNDPGEPIEFRRHERALRVLRDDSGELAGRQARSPLFVARPEGFWAYFPNPGKDGSRRFLTLNVKRPGGPGTVQLFQGKVGGAPYATGDCATRLDQQKAKS
ncbi:MAG TPA: hypothetical protein VGA98_07940 [Allosphingosinicella sp.]